MFDMLKFTGKVALAIIILNVVVVLLLGLFAFAVL